MRSSAFILINCIVLTACAVPPQTDSTPRTESAPPVQVKFGPAMLDESLRLGRQFMLENQKVAGNFEYEYDFIKKAYTNDDNQVRQTGALWGLTLIHQDSPTEETRRAVQHGMEFFGDYSIELSDDRLMIRYPGTSYGRTGTVSLAALALIDFLRTETDFPERKHYEERLSQYLAFLASLRMENGQFHANYNYETGEGFGDPSSYFDGETLLALTKAAKYLGFTQYRDIAIESAEAMHQVNVVKALEEHPDSNVTKGFYQWGSMSFYELFTSGWNETEVYAQRTINLAYWMIDTHRTLDRTRNTAYAYEGILSAWELARLTNDTKAQKKFSKVIEIGLTKLTGWQVGHWAQNSFLREHPTDDRKAIGGIMNSADESTLRIDVCQHQMHAVILARRFLFNADS